MKECFYHLYPHLFLLQFSNDFFPHFILHPHSPFLAPLAKIENGDFYLRKRF